MIGNRGATEVGAPRKNPEAPRALNFEHVRKKKRSGLIMSLNSESKHRLMQNQSAKQNSELKKISSVFKI